MSLFCKYFRRRGRYFAVILFSIFFVSCGGPKVIPDKQLVQIFHDLYLVNSVAGQSAVKFDSLNIYEPVLESYGYTSDDFRNTIGTFARRKSASLSNDIVEPVMELLRVEAERYKHRVAMVDTVAGIARRKFATRVLSRDRIAARRVADTGRLRISLPVGEGTYEVSYSYLVDSTDLNGTLRTNVYVVDSEGERVASNLYRLGRAGRGRTTQTVRTDTAARRMVIVLGSYPAKGIRTPSLTVDSLVVTRFLPDRVAVDSLAREWLDYFVRDVLRAEELRPEFDTPRVSR